MPIYAYKCSSCGHARDVMQKISDAPLTDCPECGAPAFAKQVTAAGFQLKGSGWYVTDFRDKGAKKNGDAPAKDGAEAAKPAAGDSAKESKPAAAAPAPAAAAPSPSPSPSPSAS